MVVEGLHAEDIFELVSLVLPLIISWTFRILASWNEMNRALGHLCAHIGYTGPGEPPEDGEMIEMTLSSRHRIRNSSPGGLRPSTLPLGHGGSPQYWLSHVDGEETFLFLSNCRDREPNPELWRERQRCYTTTLGPPPFGPMRKTKTLIFVYSTQTDYSRASLFGNCFSSFTLC